MTSTGTRFDFLSRVSTAISAIPFGGVAKSGVAKSHGGWLISYPNQLPPFFS
jgi:acyl-CoA reductase-like NAD-dependent aldehyde dehydrogenase